MPFPRTADNSFTACMHCQPERVSYFRILRGVWCAFYTYLLFITDPIRAWALHEVHEKAEILRWGEKDGGSFLEAGTYLGIYEFI